MTQEELAKIVGYVPKTVGENFDRTLKEKGFSGRSSAVRKLIYDFLAANK